MMAGKLGFETFDPATDQALVEELVEVLGLVETDMTLFYRRLAEVPSAQPVNATDDALMANSKAAAAPNPMIFRFIRSGPPNPRSAKLGAPR